MRSDSEMKKLAIDRLRSCKTDMDTLRSWRAQTFKKYMGEKYGNEEKGRSQVVMTDISDTVEWIMPALMRIFHGGQDVVQLRPQGPEDEANCKLMEEKLNFDFLKQNKGFLITHNWFKDALLYKAGVVKYHWQKAESHQKKKYKGLTQGEYENLENDDEFIVDEVTPKLVRTEWVFDGFQDVPNDVYEYDVKGRQIITVSKPIIEVLPPEECIFDLKAKDIPSSKIFAHRKVVTKDDFKKYNKDEKDIGAEIANGMNDPEYIARFDDLGGVQFISPDQNGEEFYLYECYVDDRDDAGEKVPKKVTIAGDETLDIEDNTYDRPPVCVISPIVIQHRIMGRSISELVEDIQLLRTALMRYILDNIYFQNNGMKVVNPYRINVDDLINGNRPGGIIRTTEDVDPSTAIFPVPIAPLPQHVMSIVEYIDGIRENKTGVTKYNQGMDSGSLNKTASGISQIMTASQQRLELIARIFAETGYQDLMRALVDMNIKFFDREQFVKVNDDWVSINPDMISGYYDVIIDVGIGTGNKEMVFNQLTNMLNTYTGVMGKMVQPGMPQIVGPQNIYNILKEMWQIQGFKNVDRFVTDPNTAAMQMPPMPPPNPLMEQDGATPPNPMMTGGIPVNGPQGGNPNV